jgi:hypothetical protein
MLLFVSSFLPYVSACALTVCASSSAWSADLFPVLPSIYLLGIGAAALILLQRFQGEAAAGRQILGLRLDQWGTALSVAALWASLWGVASTAPKGLGAWLGLLSLIVLAGAAAAGPLVPALQEPLLSDKPAAPQGVQQGYTPYPGAAQQAPAQQTGGYTYPGAPLPGQPGQVDPMQPAAYGAQQPQPTGYGYPTGAQTADLSVPEPTQALPPYQDAPLAAAAPVAAAAPFAPFWFAVPAVRPLASKDNPHGPAIGELVPGTWYLAVGEQGPALVAQLQDGTQGLLTDTNGIQRG